MFIVRCPRKDIPFCNRKLTFAIWIISKKNNNKIKRCTFINQNIHLLDNSSYAFSGCIVVVIWVDRKKFQDCDLATWGTTPHVCKGTTSIYCELELIGSSRRHNLSLEQAKGEFITMCPQRPDRKEIEEKYTLKTKFNPFVLVSGRRIR